MTVASADVDASSSLQDARFEVSFVDQGGTAHRMALLDCWGHPFERARSVRELVSHRRRRGFPGLWWFSASGEHVGYESWLERDQVMALDADPGVVAVASQPFWLSWTIAGRRVRHAPDFFARLDDGTGVVIDVRDETQIEPDGATKFTASSAACALVGWEYRRVGTLDPVLAANLRWLAGYRHPRCSNSRLAARQQDEFAEPAALLDGATGVGDPIAVLPVLFNLLWRRILWADFTTLLGPQTLVHSRGGRR